MSDERLELEKIPPPDETQMVRPGYPRAGGYPDAGVYGHGDGSADKGQKLTLLQIWRTIKKRKLLIVVVAVIVTAVVTLEVFRAKSIYQAVTTIEIAKENQTLVRSGDLVVESDESDEMFYLSVEMKTKILLLQSRPLLEDVVVNLKLDQNPKFLDVTSKRSIWEAIKSLGSRVRGERAAPASTTVVETPMTGSEGEVTRSRQESARLAPYVSVLAHNLGADPLPETRMLVLSFTHTDPVLAADIVDNVAQVFIKRTFEDKTEKYTSTSEWLDRSTRELKARVEQADQKLADYSREHKIYSLDGKESLAIVNLSRLHDLATRAQTDLLIKQSLYEEVKAGRIAQLPEAFSDPAVGILEKKLGELKTQYSELGVTYGPKNPNLIGLKQRLDAIQKQIDESRVSLGKRIEADYQRAVRDEGSLQAALNTAKAEAAEQNQAAILFNILKQDVQTTKSMYTDFLQKTNQARIQEHEQHSTIRMIDPPLVPLAPKGPNRLRTITMGFLLSLGAGVGLAFFLEYLDSTVKTVEDVCRYTQLPALSVIPAISGRKARLLTGGKLGRKKSATEFGLNDENRLGANQLAMIDRHSSVAEAYRVLRTSVLLSAVDCPAKTILITSGQPSEGKTTTVVNTAISLAQLGGSVLIIDCDLRKPAIHKVLGIGKSRGLSTYLTRNVDLNDVIQKLSIPNLSVLPCGPIPPNPSEMLSSTKMKQMLKTLAETYDHIVIDSPPLLRVTDPVILSSMVDGVILVVHAGKSTRDVVRRTRRELSIAGARIFGVVLNNVGVNNLGYNSYYSEAYSDYEQESGGTTGE